MDKNLESHVQKAENINSLGKGIPSIVGTGNTKAFRYDSPESIKKHIKNLVSPGGSAKVIRGIKKLQTAAGDTDETKPQLNKRKMAAKPQLRKGQIIFGSVSVSHHMGVDNPFSSFFLNLLAPFLLGVKTGEARKFPYLHAAVYAGKFDGCHYVIENGGFFGWNNLGMISAVPMEKAFEEDARFFIMSPPKDSDGNSTRHLILQRALACLGTFYHYHMRSVNCEVFAMTLMKLEPKFEPVQTDPNVLRHSKGHGMTDEKMDEDQTRFLKFHQALLQKLKWYQDNTILTLHYYLKKKVDKDQRAKATERCHDADVLNNACRIPWWVKMDKDYDSFADAVKQQNLEEVQALINKGLNIHGNLRGESMNAINYAVANGFTILAELLEKNGAQR